MRRACGPCAAERARPASPAESRAREEDEAFDKLCTSARCLPPFTATPLGFLGLCAVQVTVKSGQKLY